MGVAPVTPLEVTLDPELDSTPDDDRCTAVAIDCWLLGEYDDALDCCAAACCCRMFCSKFPVGPEHPRTDCCCGCLVAPTAEFVTLGELEEGDEVVSSLELGSQPSTIKIEQIKLGYFR